jgi:hypothetical protein
MKRNESCMFRYPAERLHSMDARTAGERSRQEELRLQEEFIARNGVKRLAPITKESDLERWHRINDLKRELREKYRKQAPPGSG